MISGMLRDPISRPSRINLYFAFDLHFPNLAACCTRYFLTESSDGICKANRHIECAVHLLDHWRFRQYPNLLSWKTMPPTDFQRFVEEMNQQSVDQRPGRQGSSALLPHQRRQQPMPQPIPTQEPKSQTPGQASKECMSHDPFRQEVPAVCSNVSMDNEARRNEYSSPQPNQVTDVRQSNAQPLDHQPQSSKLPVVDSNLRQRSSSASIQQNKPFQFPQGSNATNVSPSLNNGLSKSRWADPSHNRTPINLINRLPANKSTLIENKPRAPTDNHVVTQSKDTPSYWGSIQKRPFLVENEKAVTKVGQHAPPEQKDNITYWNTSDLNGPRHHEQGGEQALENQAYNSDLQPLTPAALGQATGEGLEIKTKTTEALSHVEELGVGKLSLEDSVTDPRMSWPTESNFQAKIDPDFVNQDWNQTRRPRKKSLDETSSSTEGIVAVPKYMTDYIKAWIQGAHVVTASFLHQNVAGHEDCDVDTYEGTLNKPIKYPTTVRQTIISRRQLETTSERSMKEWVAMVARKDPKRKAERKAAKEAKAAAKAAAEIEPEPFVEPPNPNEVQTPCHLRPVNGGDIGAITAIYNQEIADGYKVMDTKPVSSDNFNRIYSQCLAEKMPFVVAIEGWHGAADASHSDVIGFALVTAVYRGISGSYETLSRPGGKLLVIVKPEYRRKKIGTALIDVILSSCSTRYMPKGGYQFVNIAQDRTLMRYESNPRAWYYLEMEVMILSFENEEKTRQHDEFQWIWNFLEAKFCLLLKHYDDRCFFEPLHKKWLDKLTFRHTCRALGY
ncbi:hypothetical protein HD806DRAFT_542797 [Xylariaceae sp. AK1471]|nr:hypothetical protein HD806DRAFT_542797 [Xylariaceae sp. AK1471]